MTFNKNSTKTFILSRSFVLNPMHYLPVKFPFLLFLHNEADPNEIPFTETTKISSKSKALAWSWDPFSLPFLFGFQSD
jgi:hypothetical protein